MSEDDLTGRQIGSYEVRSRIGAGGMGEVYLAHDLKLDRPVALKRLAPHLCADAERLQRFGQEARAVSSLNHPHILVIHDFGDADGRPFIVTEFVEGETLRTRLTRGALPLGDALAIATQVASALGAAHARGIVHRDVKPENVMIRPDGYVKVLDFGLAKLAASAAVSEETELRTLPGVVMGTPRYMSPEQARGLELDARSDVWSLGVVLYEMIAGRPPFSGQTSTDILADVLRGDVTPLEARVPEVPRPLASLVATALSRNPDARFASGRELHAGLLAVKAAIDSGPHTARAPGARTPPGGSKRPRRGGIDSLAVLPFVNASGDPDTEYFSDGVTEHIIGRLSALPRLRVMARSATFRYKGRDVDPLAVGRELNVRAVLTGRLVQRSERLMVSLELVDVDEGWRLWGAQYDVPLADIFSLQDTIATELSDKLRLKLSGQERTRLVSRQTLSVEAYQAYLRGRFAWNRRVESGFRQAIRYFEEAIAADPTYAMAYVGLGDCYALLGIAEYGGMPPREAMPKAKWAALKALEIDERLAEAHTTLAHVMGFYDWDWAGAEREFARAIELNPKYPFAHHWRALFLAAMRRFDEAIASELLALDLEPLSLIINKNVGTIYYYARQDHRALEQYRKTLELDPEFARTHFYLGLEYLVTAQPDAAVAEFRKGLALSGGSNVVLGALGYALGRAGLEAEARDTLDELTRRSQSQYVAAFNRAVIHIGLGELDRAFELLNAAYDERSSWLVSLNIEPLLDPIRGDSRFVDLVRRVGLP